VIAVADDPEKLLDQARESKRRQWQLRCELERCLLEQLLKGSPVTDRRGFPVLDDKGKLVYGPTSPLILREVREYLRNVGAFEVGNNPDAIIGGIVSRVTATMMQREQARVAASENPALGPPVAVDEGEEVNRCH